MNRRDFIGAAALAGMLPLLGTGSAVAAQTRGGGRLLPVPLVKGDTIYEA